MASDTDNANGAANEKVVDGANSSPGAGAVGAEAAGANATGTHGTPGAGAVGAEAAGANAAGAHGSPGAGAVGAEAARANAAGTHGTSGAGAVGADVPDTGLPMGTLDANSDIPLSCAVFRVSIDEEAGVATDARYEYVSPAYCREIARSSEGLLDRSYLEVGAIDKGKWLDQCYRAVVNGETINGFEYNDLARDWICYRIAPSYDEGCCVYTFIKVAMGEEQRNQIMSSADVRTSRLVSEMLTALSTEQSHEAAMNGILEMMSRVIRADRLSIFQSVGNNMEVTFELCAEGVTPRLGSVYPVPEDALEYWFRYLGDANVMLVPDTAIMERFSPGLHEWCRANSVRSLMAAPFFSSGQIVGFLGAYNYQVDETIDLNRLFGTLSSLIGARLDVQRLIQDLEWAGLHDPLTNLLNRRGCERAIRDLLETRPDGRYVMAAIDIDDFKRINDMYGHNVGDEALKAVAKAMERAFPADAVLARNGGDEFLVLMPDDGVGEGAGGGRGVEPAGGAEGGRGVEPDDGVGEGAGGGRGVKPAGGAEGIGADAFSVGPGLGANAGRSAEEIIAAFSQTQLEFEYEGGRHEATMSIGYACYPEHTDAVTKLYARADAALYAVKLSGKAGFAKYTPEVETHYRSQLAFTARDILDYVPYAMVVHNAECDGPILFATARLAELLGYESMYDLMRESGGALTGLVHPSDQERVFAELAGHTAEGGVSPAFSFDFRAITKTGDSLPVRATSRCASITQTEDAFYTILALD